jgi:hypothetical protein
VGYIAIGTDAFTRIAPSNGSVYNGNMGGYNVSWTRATGSPGFLGIKFEPTLKNLTNGASDIFSIEVTNFVPNTTIRVGGFGGKLPEETFNFLLSQTLCAPRRSTATPEILSFSEADTEAWDKLLAWLGPPQRNATWALFDVSPFGRHRTRF